MVKHSRTDVLVIGGSGAALRAALEAKKHVDEVLVVSKGVVGKSGCFAVSEGYYDAPFGHVDAKDNPEAYFKDIVIGGAYINNQKLVEALVSEASQRMLDLVGYGVNFMKTDDRFHQIRVGGHTYPRVCLLSPLKPKCGVTLTKTLAEKARRESVKLLENIMVTTILTKGKSAVGAMGFNRKDGEFQVFSSKTTVLATGGTGRLYMHTNNPVGVTGDGYAMAMHAGAELVDMEFVQFYPTMSLSPTPGFLVLPSVFPDGAELLNSLGEKFMFKYDPEKGHLSTRDKMSRAILLEVMGGRGVGGGVYLNYATMPREVIEKTHRSDLNLFLNNRVDIRKTPIVVSPAPHFCMGGVRINERCETSLQNLYAAGEVAGGVHGANRIPGNAYTESQVFGARAGRYAGEKATFTTFEEPDKSQVEQQIEGVKAFRKHDGQTPSEVIRELRAVMWNYVGVVRNGEGLRKALLELNRIRSEVLPKVKAENPEELVSAVELSNMLDVGQAVAESALLRTETRGAHYRTDCPNENDKRWLKNIVISLKNGKLLKETTPTVATRIKIQ